MSKLKLSRNKIIIISASILLLCIAVFFCLKRRVVIELDHDDYISIAENEDWQDSLNSQARCCNLFSCEDISDQLKYENTFHIGEIGIYENKVLLDFKDKHYEKLWKLEVRDTTAPELELSGSSELIMYAGDDYIEPGVTANDNHDGDLSAQITTDGEVKNKAEGTYVLKYSVSDAAGNSSSVERKVIVKQTPVIISHDSSTLQKDEGLLGDRKIAFYREVEKYIADNKLDVAIGYYDFKTGNQYTYRSNQTFYGASLVKAATAMYAYDKGKLTSEIRGLASKAISVSDNDSHMRLVDILGQSKIKSYAQKMGAKHYMTGSSAHYYGDTTVEDQLCIWKYLWTNIDSMQSGSELKSYFANTYYNNIQKGHGVKTYHKAGWYGKVIHDVGVVMDGDNPYLLVVLTNHGNSGAKVIQNIAKIVQKY